MRILIKGAGDLATGIASRLYRSGHQIMMTEIAVPLTVRRMAALSRAVYDGEAQVEDMKGVLADSMEQAHEVLAMGNIPIFVDEQAKVAGQYQPDILIDAVLAKKNLGTTIMDASFVIGVGPGFTAGLDCHCVVETQRGHTLGNTIYDGSAIPNTGVPGEIGGYTVERLIRAAGDGELEPFVSIGDVVREGQLVASTGGKEVRALMGGMVRGMLQPGVSVTKNLKIGDIDARCEHTNCFTISDKARAVGGGVLEAVTRFEHMRGNYAAVILAAGGSLRFGGNKLLAPVSEKPLYRYTLERIQAFQTFPVYIVTGYGQIMEEAGKRGFRTVINREPELGISHSIKLGLEACLRQHPQIQGILFSVCDQPGLKAATIQRLLNEASTHKGQIICAGSLGRPGNPVVWDRTYFPALLGLQGDHGGRQVMSQYPEKVRYAEAGPEELKDIDVKEDLI